MALPNWLAMHMVPGPQGDGSQGSGFSTHLEEEENSGLRAHEIFSQSTVAMKSLVLGFKNDSKHGSFTDWKSGVSIRSACGFWYGRCAYRSRNSIGTKFVVIKL